MIPVASYCRVSTDKEDQANSFAAQQRFFRDYIRMHPDWQLYEIYADEGITGTSTKRRTQFQRMIQDAYAGKFQLIITKEISRFSRNILDTLSYTRELKALGVGVLFLTENLNTLNPEAEMLMTFMGTIAQEESRRTSVRVKWGQTRQMEQGVVFGPSLLGYEVKAGQMTIKPEEAELVRLIFHKYGVEKKGTSVIARELQAAGYHTRSGSPRWNASCIVKILKNEKYVGDLVQKKSITPDYLTHQKRANHGEETQVVLLDHHAPIIDRALWDTVQQELAARSRHSTGTGHATRYAFSGKIRCGVCGASFVGRTKTRGDGTKLRRWSCYTAVSQGGGGCDVGRLVRDDDARQMLKTALNSLRMDREAILNEVTELVLEVLRSTDLDIGNDPAQLQRQIEQIQRKKTAALDSYFDGVVTREEMLMAKERYDTQIKQLKKDLDTCCQQPTMEQQEIQKMLRAILNGKLESDSFDRGLIDTLTIYPDHHLELRLNHLPQVFWFTT